MCTLESRGKVVVLVGWLAFLVACGKLVGWVHNNNNDKRRRRRKTRPGG